MRLEQRGHTPLALTQNALISALSEGLLRIPQSPVLMLPPSLASHSPWDYAPITLPLLGSGAVCPQDWRFLKGGVTSGLCSRERGEEVRGAPAAKLPKKGDLGSPHSYSESSN